MMYALMLLCISEATPIDASNSLIAMAREAETCFPGWENVDGFYGFAVVDMTSGVVVYMAE